MIWMLRSFFLLFSGETSPFQISAGICFGLVLGFVPMDNLVWPALVFLLLLFRVNLSMSLVFFGLGQLVSLALGSLIASFGTHLLNLPSLNALWTYIYNTPVLAISGFNRPEVMGALCMGLIVSVFFFPLWVYIIRLYRKKILAWLEKIWIVRLLKGSVFFRWYSKIVNI